MPKILFLDDDQCRRVAFKEKYPDAVLVATADEAIRELEKKFVFWDAVFLDYDLEEGNSEGVARWIVQSLPHRPEQWYSTGIDIKQIVIHSTNVIGALRLLEIFKNRVPCVYVPFDYETWIKP